MSTRFEMHAGTPLLATVPESSGGRLSKEDCRVHECGEQRGKWSFFCQAHAFTQSATSIALIVGGLVVAADGSILGQGSLAMR